MSDGTRSGEDLAARAKFLLSQKYRNGLPAQIDHPVLTSDNKQVADVEVRLQESTSLGTGHTLSLCSSRSITRQTQPARETRRSVS
jgi:hypothetical protein